MMASTTGKSGKCSNFGNCSLADARASVEVPTGLDFVCTECGKPLLLSAGSETGGSSQSRTLLLGALALGVLLLGVALAVWFWWSGKKTPDAAPAPPPTPAAVAPAPAAPAPLPTEPPKDPVQSAPLPVKPETGYCSDADARSGLCSKAR